MRIRAILRFRNEDLTQKRLIAGFETQAQLAKYLGISQTIVSAWETLRTFPKERKIINKLEEALRCEIEEIFPPEIINAIRKRIGVPLEKVIDTKALPPFIRGEYLLEAPEEKYEKKELKETIEELLKTLTEKESKVLTLKFGLADGNEYTLQEIAEQLKLSNERIRQIGAKALRKLRHPMRSLKLRQFSDVEGLCLLEERLKSYSEE